MASDFDNGIMNSFLDLRIHRIVDGCGDCLLDRGADEIALDGVVDGAADCSVDDFVDWLLGNV